MGVTVQLYEMSIGLRSKLDLNLIVSQALATTLSAKIKHSKDDEHVPSKLTITDDGTGTPVIAAK